MAQRRAVTVEQASRRPKATRAEKSAILDAVCTVTGWHRDHARKVLRQGDPVPAVRPRPARTPVMKYGPDVIDALVAC